MPRRWTIKEEKEKRKELIEFYINQNKTIREVSKILQIAEPTVFDRLKRLNIPSVPERKLHYLNRKRGTLIFPDFSESLAEFFGIMLGDGHIGPSQIWIYVNTTTDEEYILYVKNLLKSLFGIDVGCHHRKSNKMVDLFISSVDLVSYLKERGLYISNKVRHQADIPLWILDNDSYKKSFLRGFFDTDGSVYLLKFGVQMSFCNRSVPLLQSTRKILLDLKYHPSKISRYNLYLTRKSDLVRYAEEIGFGNRKHCKKIKRFGIIQKGV